MLFIFLDILYTAAHQILVYQTQENLNLILGRYSIRSVGIQEVNNIQISIKNLLEKMIRLFY